MTNYAYDAANRLTSVNGVAYTWDNNGNLLNDGTNTYTYDAANRLTSVVGGGNTSSYTYNGLGDRLSQTVNAATTNYTLDLNAGLTQVLADGSNTYLYGAMRIGELQAGGMAYHLGDALGSVRQLTDAGGNVTLARSYEPYGTTLSSAGTGSSVFQFTGEQRDTATNLTYLRARYLASYLNQWIQPDMIVPDWRNPQALNRYSYVNNNPVNFTDPSGHCSDDPNVDDDECWKTYAKVVDALGGANNWAMTRDPKAQALLKAWETHQLLELLNLIKNRASSGRLSRSIGYDERLWLVSFFGGAQSYRNLSGSIDAVEAMARWVELTVALHNGLGLGSGDVMDDLLLVENGFTKDSSGIPTYVGPVAQQLHSGLFNDAGFNPIFQDADDQVFHAMFFVAVGSEFPIGPFFAEGANVWHETFDPGVCRTHNNCLYGKSLQDFLLSERAIGVGIAMNRSSGSTWGNWIRLGFRSGVFISPLDWPTFKDC